MENKFYKIFDINPDKEITDRKLLELICVLTAYNPKPINTVEELREHVLYSCVDKYFIINERVKGVFGK